MHIGWKLRVVEQIQEKCIWPRSGQKWSCRALKISWHVGLGRRTLWCKFEKDQLNAGVYSVHKKHTNLAFWWPQLEPQGGENWLVSRPWSNAYLVYIWRKSVENWGLWSTHKKTPFGPLLATNGIAERPKSIGILTFVKGLRSDWGYNYNNIIVIFESLQPVDS